MTAEHRPVSEGNGPLNYNFDYDHLPQLFDHVKPVTAEQRRVIYDRVSPWSPYFQNNTGNHMETVLAIMTGELRIPGSALIEPLQNHLSRLTTTARAPTLDHGILDLVDMELNHAPWLGVHNHRVSVRAQRNMAIASVRDIIRFTGIDFPTKAEIEKAMQKFIRPKLKAVGYGGLIHDLGKVGTASAKPFDDSAEDLAGVQRIDLLWNFPGRNLDDVQRNLIKLHPWFGIVYAAIAGINNPKSTTHRRIITFIANHHEDIDGTGYPRGLKGENVTVIGTVGRLADIGDVIGHLSDRPYNDPVELPPSVQYAKIMEECRRLPNVWTEVAVAAENMVHTSQLSELTESPLLPGSMQAVDLPPTIDMVRMVHYNAKRLTRTLGSAYAQAGSQFRRDPEWIATRSIFR